MADCQQGKGAGGPGHGSGQAGGLAGELPLGTGLRLDGELLRSAAGG
mgnify:CR=1 FL=1